MLWKNVTKKIILSMHDIKKIIFAGTRVSVELAKANAVEAFVFFSRSGDQYNNVNKYKQILFTINYTLCSIV